MIGINLNFNNASKRDKALLSMLVLAICFSPAIAGLAIGYCIFFFLGTRFIAFVLGVLLTILLFMHHKSLIDHIKGKVIVFVIGLSLVISGLLSLPLKFSSEEDEIRQEMIDENFNKAQEAAAKLNSWVEDQELKREKLNGNVTDAAIAYDNTGKKQQLFDSRRALNSFNESYDARLDNATSKFVLESGYIDDFSPSKMEVFKYYINQIRNGDSGDQSMFWITFFLFLILEGSPGFIALGLLGGSYARGLERQEEYRKMQERDLEKNLETSESISKQQHEELDKVSEDLDYLPNYLLRKDVFDSLRENIHSDFSKPEELLGKYKLYQSSKFDSPEDSRIINLGKQEDEDSKANESKEIPKDEDDDIPMVVY